MVTNSASAVCRHCGAEFHLFTIFNRDMNGLCKVWKRKHERACKDRSPDARRRWARKYVGKTRIESSIVVNMHHPGFAVTDVSEQA